MGYELHITRAPSNFFENEGCEIGVNEFLSIVERDPELKLAGYNGPHHTVFVDEPAYGTWLDWCHGNIDSKAPSSRMILKMIDIAERLKARMQGDELEYYDRESETLREYIEFQAKRSQEQEKK